MLRRNSRLFTVTSEHIRFYFLVWGIHIVSPEEEKEGCDGKDLQKKKVLSLEWKSEWMMEN